MREIASAIRIGANAFIEYEYRVLLRVILVVAVVLGIVTMWQAAVALLIGASMSACAGFIGIKIATYANVRVANVARETKDIGKTVKVAFRGGSVMGLCVGGFALLGLFIVDNRVTDMLRMNGRHPAAEYNDEILSGLSSELHIDDLLTEAILKLPEQQRHVIWLKYYHGYSLREISKMLGITLSWAQKINQRAKKQLEILYKEGGGEF